MKRLSTLGHLNTATAQHKQAWIDWNTHTLRLYTHIHNTHHLTKALHLFTDAPLRSAAHKHTNCIVVFSRLPALYSLLVFSVLDLWFVYHWRLFSPWWAVLILKHTPFPITTGSRDEASQAAATALILFTNQTHSASNSQDTQPSPGPRNKMLSQITAKDSAPPAMISNWNYMLFKVVVKCSIPNLNVVLFLL